MSPDTDTRTTLKLASVTSIAAGKPEMVLDPIYEEAIVETIAFLEQCIVEIKSGELSAIAIVVVNKTVTERRCRAFSNGDFMPKLLAHLNRLYLDVLNAITD